MATFALFTDANLTVPFTGSLTAQQNVDGTTGRQDFTLYLGSNTAGKLLKAESNPGVDQITLSVVDSATGTGHPASDVKLALTQGGLDTATGGASLNLGTTITAGVANAVQFWIGLTDSTHVVGTSTELSVVTNTLAEF